MVQLLHNSDSGNSDGSCNGNGNGNGDDSLLFGNGRCNGTATVTGMEGAMAQIWQWWTARQHLNSNNGNVNGWMAMAEIVHVTVTAMEGATATQRATEST